jgi:hypothetical protein
LFVRFFPAGKKGVYAAFCTIILPYVPKFLYKGAAAVSIEGKKHSASPRFLLSFYSFLFYIS